ncbi:hypothetical protein J7K74_00025 [Candidatus Woesearchaeota archaeon]|nr:hypothetical protein [Candidatus Woesearchaeota archaeon]
MFDPEDAYKISDQYTQDLGVVTRDPSICIFQTPDGTPCYVPKSAFYNLIPNSEKYLEERYFLIKE